jgi:hypothetical protein
MSLRSYEKKNIYLLRNFDTATREAQNAFLKMLEEPPKDSIILLVGQHPENFIETILSRVFVFENTHSLVRTLEAAEFGALQEFQKGNIIPIFEVLQSKNIDPLTARSYLYTMIQMTPYPMWIDICEQGIIDLQTTNETPKSLLERVFLCHS